MLKFFYLFLVVIVIDSCSSTKKIDDGDDGITYADTGGLSLLFKLENESNGTLLINNKDSIAFNYKLKKTSKNLVYSKTKRERKTIIYEYHIQYPYNKIKEYEILRKYLILISLKKQSILRYESHAK